MATVCLASNSPVHWRRVFWPEKWSVSVVPVVILVAFFFFVWSTDFHESLANFVDIIDREILRSVKYIFEIFSINLVFLIRANWNEEMDVSCFAMVEEFSY